MPRPFKQLDREAFAALVDRFPFRRRINAVHMHHTWRPRRTDYRGHETIVGMWRHHTQKNGWSDIAQHITIAPDGTIWLGRDWNQPPASAAGHNGNAAAGPFMFEIVGDFDTGREPLDGEQRATVIEVIARVQHRFGLAAETLVFHNAMSGKTCPGSSVGRADILDEVRAARARLQALPRSIGPDGQAAELAPEVEQAVQASIELLARPGMRGIDPPDAEPDCRHEEHADEARQSGDTARDSGLSPQTLQQLRPHLVNLAMGQFSTDGEWKTTREDVDSIFDEHLPAAREAAAQAGRPLRIVFYAHGGLNSESVGLQIAHKSVDWWKANGLYPIYFTWETGAFETIGQLIRRSQQDAARAVARDVADFTSDPLVEIAVRALQGPRIWGGMKLSARLASAGPDSPDGQGGAHYVAQKLAAFCAAGGAPVELHAAGHSAGSIFMAEFLPVALRLGAPAFASLHLMAPAIRADAFLRSLAGLVGADRGIAQLTVFTMTKDYERADHCARLYRKSLLYLIHYALEPERKAPILGLEASLRADGALRRLFGLDGRPGAAEVVWSVSDAANRRSASTATSHGGFDDDAPTMNSIARRMLGKADADEIVDYVSGQTGARAADSWNEQVDWPEELGNGTSGQPGSGAGASSGSTSVHGPEPLRMEHGPAGEGSVGTAATGAETANSAGHGGPGAASGGPGLPGADSGRQGARRRALCVGINRYTDAPLSGCVADARAWAGALRRLGFEPPAMLLDEQATRGAIVQALEDLVTQSRPGDVLAFQFAGHGTQAPDLNGDEFGGDTPGQDEALCPIDYARGALLIDDDIGAIFDRLPEGVNLTCFIDCCHSGTVSRVGVGSPPRSAAVAPGERARFVNLSEEAIEAHRRFRAAMGGTRQAGSGGPNRMRDILFSACLSSQVAWESRGHGEFTVHALDALRAGLQGMTNQQFLARVTAAFGPSARQNPRLYCVPAAAGQGLLQPVSSRLASADGAPAVLPAAAPVIAPAAGPVAAPPAVSVPAADLAALLQGMQQLIAQMQSRH